ncbi:MAG TPA: cell division protein ZipA C-terminal FtsZ-binding domain-containing protein [Steroidobacteraceae bacterium]|nr:cell division protein ZipA C-terminal FtsZ-binding domain-containing protein [Steroidobacteraceae bacterium]
MSELRWTLLILGVVFIAALSWWERRRPRQAFAPRLRDASLAPADYAQADAQRTASSPEPGVAGEPWIGEAGLAEVVSSDVTLASDIGARQPGGQGSIGPLEELPTLLIPDTQEQLALKAAWDEQPPEPTLIDPQVTPSAGETAEVPAQTAPTDAAGQAPEQDETEPEIFGAEGIGAVRIVEPFPGGGVPPEPIVEWPPEQSRRILALRLVAPQAERFPGRALRLAMAAEGFVLGKFSIFHRPDEANRAVLSAASLTRPGSFDLTTMDSQRYGGLSLFAVLPGPKAPPQAFEDLLATARNLNERLQGALQDERGGPLTPLRVASIRDGLRAEAATLQAAAAHEA